MARWLAAATSAVAPAVDRSGARFDRPRIVVARLLAWEKAPTVQNHTVGLFVSPRIFGELRSVVRVW